MCAICITWRRTVRDFSETSTNKTD
jgi:hypothetical protein